MCVARCESLRGDSPQNENGAKNANISLFQINYSQTDEGLAQFPKIFQIVYSMWGTVCVCVLVYLYLWGHSFCKCSSWDVLEAPLGYCEI